MKKFKILIGLAVVLITITSCTSSMYRSGSYLTDDLYEIHDRKAIAIKKKAKAEARIAEAEARNAEWNARMAEARAEAAENSYGENRYDNYIEDTYDGAYARRLRGFESPSYNMPSSYFDFRYSSAFHYATAYDPAFYNVIVMGDEVWVEPRYISSMFGSWGRSSMYGGWYFGWGVRPNYGWYGYNHHSWWDWNYNMCYRPGYNPWWGFGYPYYPSWGNSWYPGGGHHGGWYPGGGRPTPGGYRPNIVNRPSAYVSPTTGRDFGSSRSSGSGSIDRGGSTRPTFGVRSSATNRDNRATVDRGSNSRSSSGVRSNRGGTSTYRDRNSSSSSSNSSSSSSYNRGSSSSSSSSYNRGSSSSSSSRSSSGSSYRGSSSGSSGRATGRNAGGR